MREQGEFNLSNWKKDPLNPKDASEESLKWFHLFFHCLVFMIVINFKDFCGRFVKLFFLGELSRRIKHHQMEGRKIYGLLVSLRGH